MTKIRNKSPEPIIDGLPICYFNDTYDDDGKKVGSKKTRFCKYVRWVRRLNDDYIKDVEHIRKLKRLKKAKAYKAAKWKLAFHFYPSCTFDGKGCKVKNVVSISGLIVYDLQGVPDDVYHALIKWKHTVAIHKSIGGGNNYALFLFCPGLTVENFGKIWESGNELIQSEFNITPEQSDNTKDVTRIRYLSYDPDIYYNPNAEPVFVKDIVIKTEFSSEAKKAIDKILDKEPEWYKFGLAIARAKGEDGRELYHTFSKENPEKYDEAECDQKYDRLLQDAKDERKHGITQGTLFYLLKQMHVPYIIPKGQTEYGEELSPEEVIKYLNENWGRNEINDRIYNIKTGREASVETVWTQFQLAFNDRKYPLHNIQAFLRSESMNTFNPIKDFFNDCKRVYDGGKHIKTFISTLPFADSETANLFIRYWCICAYRQAYANEVNRLFLIFQGAEEIGKSKALEWLCPLPEYLKTSPLNTDNKDTRIAIAQNFLWIDDELKVFRAHDINKIKALISQSVVNERAPYARGAQTFKRICSFCGSTNESEIMPANEGNTRFLICEFSGKADWKRYTQIDKKQFWGEVISLYENGWIEKNSEQLSTTRKKVNKDKIMNDVITDLLKANFVSTRNDRKRIVYKLQEVIDEIDPERRYNAIAKQEFLRSMLTKMFGPGRTTGFDPKTKLRTTGYPCRHKKDKLDARSNF